MDIRHGKRAAHQTLYIVGHLDSFLDIHTDSDFFRVINVQ